MACLSFSQAIVVEGRYDKTRLSSIVDSLVISTDGFCIFRDKKKMQWLQNLAVNSGLIVFTDADGAGLLIRNHISNCIPPQYLFHAYIPEVYGKEGRKHAPASANLLGVEGMQTDVIKKALLESGATLITPTRTDITKSMLFELGLCGCENSAKVRRHLLKLLDIPTNISTNALLKVLNIRFGADEFYDFWKTSEVNCNG